MRWAYEVRSVWGDVSLSLCVEGATQNAVKTEENDDGEIGFQGFQGYHLSP